LSRREYDATGERIAMPIQDQERVGVAIHQERDGVGATREITIQAPTQSE
jgi:hypothetical protein